jgi:hypothetical protein
MKRFLRQQKFVLYKIPGRLGAVPDDVWSSQDIEALRPFLEVQRDEVILPSVTNPAFPKLFQKVSGAFLDKNWKDAIADRRRWKQVGVWVICSLGQPSWVLIRK